MKTGTLKTDTYNSLIILGPTAVGKTALAVAAADYFDSEIISADCRQVYKGLDLGSGKDIKEYSIQKDDGCIKKIPYHLIDIVDLHAEYSVFNYQKDFYKTFAALQEKKVFPIICGGTGMYLDAIVRSYDMIDVPLNSALRTSLNGKSLEELGDILRSLKPELHNETDLTERHRVLRAIEIAEYSNSEQCKREKEAMPPRPCIKPFIVGTTFPRDIVRNRVKIRLKQRFDEGMIDEVESLHKQGFSWERLERLGLEYRFIAEYLQGKIPSFDELFQSLHIAIGQFVKRQETWFRGMERKGVTIHWLPTNLYEKSLDERLQSLLQLLEEYEVHF